MQPECTRCSARPGFLHPFARRKRGCSSPHPSRTRARVAERWPQILQRGQHGRLILVRACQGGVELNGETCTDRRFRNSSIQGRHMSGLLCFFFCGGGVVRAAFV